VLAVGVAGAAGLLAGCTGGTDAPPVTTRAHGADAASPTASSADDLLRTAAVDRERALLAAYDRAAAAEPDRAALLAQVRAQHVEHLGALLGDADASITAGASAAAPSVSSASPSPVELAELVKRERAAGAEHAAAAVVAADVALAGLLASLAASEASHAVVLI